MKEEKLEKLYCKIYRLGTIRLAIRNIEDSIEELMDSFEEHGENLTKELLDYILINAKRKIYEERN